MSSASETQTEPVSHAHRHAPARWRLAHSLALGSLAGAIALTGWMLVPRARVLAWMVVALLLLAMTVVVGLATTRRAIGALIDHRNRLSLSRLQMLAWGVLVGSGFFTAGMANAMAGESDPLRVAIPGSLWALMSIGTASFVGTPLVQNTKTRRPADPTERAQTLQSLAGRRGLSDPDAVYATNGQLVICHDPSGAGMSDLFTGEEVGDASHVSLAKLQLFDATLLGIVVYATALAGALAAPLPIRAFPALDSGLVTLLGLGHAGYLAQKAISQSRIPASSAPTEVGQRGTTR